MSDEEKAKAERAEKAAKAREKALAHKKANEGKGSKAVVAMAVSDGKQVKHPVPRLKKRFQESVDPQFQERLGYEDPLQVPRLVKIVVNMGVSEAKENVQILDQARESRPDHGAVAPAGGPTNPFPTSSSARACPSACG